MLATIDMRAIPHWMPWQQRQGWVTLRIMTIHHLDTFRYWFGDPVRVFASIRPDPRTSKKFTHDDGICLYILEYANGLRASVVGRRLDRPRPRRGAEGHLASAGESKGPKAWPAARSAGPSIPARRPARSISPPSSNPATGSQPRWPEVWFPDAFVGTMAQLLVALEEKSEPEISGQDNLKTMALVDACYVSAKEHRAVELREIMKRSGA